MPIRLLKLFVLFSCHKSFHKCYIHLYSVRVQYMHASKWRTIRCFGMEIG